MDTHVLDCPNAVAIIGMSGRFPGAANLDEFWQNLANGVESVRFFTDDELLAAGVPHELLHDPDYVKAAPVLDGIDLFDAKFFGIAPREAKVTDPQHRLFLMCAWEALEHAGYCGETYDGAIGVFAGTGPSMGTYVASETHVNPALFSVAGSREHIGSDKDYLCTRVSYKLNLRGPSINVQTACSTSLVAVHLACQSVLMGESDLALAGGVTVRVPQFKGHQTRESAMSSHDGHCRTFDAEATGTIFGSGVGVVVLKRLAAAIADRDVIHAVIRGTAVNNDGSSKISFWASSIDGQVPAISEALAVAELDPRTVTMLEAHGTATSLGDPVEVQALTHAFQTPENRTSYCAIGSVKTNIGHLDSASGVAGLIKTVLALKHRAIPASLNFCTPNPRINFSSTPFYVNTELRPWDAGSEPRRAAVNSLGIGGTNAFVVLEESPTTDEVETPAAPGMCLLPLSAKSENALRELADRYVHHFDQNPHERLMDIAYTAATGRAMMPHRLAVVADSVHDAKAGLERFLAGQASGQVAVGQVPRRGVPKVAMLFPDSLSRAPIEYRILYESDSVFRSILDRWAKRVLASTGKLLLPTVFPDQDPPADPANHISLSLASVAIQATLAEWIRGWGLQPSAVSGYGSGSVTARLVSGELPMDEVLRQWREASEVSAPSHLPFPDGSQPDVVWEIGWQASAQTEWLREAHCQHLPGLAAGSSPWPHLLRQLADLFVLGASVNWKKCFEGAPPLRRLALPTYPFQLKSFWSDPVSASLSGRFGSRDARLGKDTHPILGRRQLSALHPNQRSYEFVLDFGNPSLPSHPHKKGTKAAAESTYIKWIQLAIEDVFAAPQGVCRNVTEHEPLMIEDGDTRIVQVSLVEESPQTLQIAIHSRDRSPKHAGQIAWKHHASTLVDLPKS
jgi:acyl transferase domain-containing protein